MYTILKLMLFVDDNYIILVNVLRHTHASNRGIQTLNITPDIDTFKHETSTQKFNTYTDDMRNHNTHDTRSRQFR